MIRKRSFVGLYLGPIAAFLAAAGLLLRLAAAALIAPIGSPFDAVSSQAGRGALGYEICFHAAPSSADEQPELPAPQNNRAHDCMACCAPASLVGAPPLAIDLPVRRETRVDRLIASTPTVAALSVHVVRQRGPPPV